jgi:hypothetical protein
MLQKLMVCLAPTVIQSFFYPRSYDFYGFLWSGGFSVFAGVGERTREGNDLYREMIESGVIKLGDQQVSTIGHSSVFLF